MTHQSGSLGIIRVQSLVHACQILATNARQLTPRGRTRSPVGSSLVRAHDTSNLNVASLSAHELAASQMHVNGKRIDKTRRNGRNFIGFVSQCHRLARLTALLGLCASFTLAHADGEKKLAPLESRLVGKNAAVDSQYSDLWKSRVKPAPATSTPAPTSAPTSVDRPANVNTSDSNATAADTSVTDNSEVITSSESSPAAISQDTGAHSNESATPLVETRTNTGLEELNTLAPDNIQPDMLGVISVHNGPAQASIFRDNAAILKQPNVLETVVTTTTYGNDKTETVTEVITLEQSELEQSETLHERDSVGNENLTIQTFAAIQPAALTSEPHQQESPLSWQTVTISKGDTLVSLFKGLGIDPKLAVKIAESDSKNTLNNLIVGRPMALLTSRDGKFDSMRYEISTDRHLKARYHEDGNIIIDDIYPQPEETQQLSNGEHQAYGFIKSNLFEAGLGVGLDPVLIAKFANIFGYEIDFSTDLRVGDRFSLIYKTDNKDGEKPRGGDIIAAEFINNGKRHRAIRYVDKEGEANFYTPDGYSLKKAFFRSPVEFIRISSSFSNRRFHPVLRKWKAHRGVDYAAATGTPVMATADGVITHRSAMGNYGRTVIIRHENNYETLYAHLSDYGRSQRVGQKVSQGKVIGYVGKSGNATGPHLHYEFRVKGIHRNPVDFISDQGPGERIPDKYRRDFKDVVSLLSSRLDSLNAEIAQNRSNEQPDKS